MTHTKPRYQNRSMETLYQTLLTLAEDKTSELYLKNGGQRGGANVRLAFWDGFNGVTRSPHASPNTLGWACYQAGKEFARRQKTTKRPERALDVLEELVNGCTPPRVPSDTKVYGTCAPDKALLERARSFVHSHRPA